VSFKRHPTRALWHAHVFAGGCRDEVHRRFDAVEDASGIYVLDVGEKQIVRQCRSRSGAVRSAMAAAKRWDRQERA
jgi:hypothetical protein